VLLGPIGFASQGSVSDRLTSPTNAVWRCTIRAIARQAEAERERRAKIINAEGEQIPSSA
jgi:regulator of protease activity HflC (stomatin/prohibitin superfamily)